MDAWFEILLRIPAEDVFKFKGVCKAWHELIMSQSFTQSHLERRSSRPISGILMEMDYWSGCNKKRIFYFDLNSCEGVECACHCNFRVIKDYVCPQVCMRWKKERLLASCDGLLLICYAERGRNYQLLICNPITGSHRSLPLFQSSDILDFWCISERYNWTLVRNGSIGKYKVLGIQKYDTSPRRCHTFELQRDDEGQFRHNWKKLDAPLPRRSSIKASTIKGGKVYWLATQNELRYHYKIYLLSFDILTDEFMVSAHIELSQTQRNYFALDGTFYCSQLYGMDRRKVWALENFGGGLAWIECEKIPSVCPQSAESMEHVARFGSFKLVNEFHCYTHVFDMTYKKWGITKFDSKRSLPSCAREIVTHVNSLVGC